MMQNSHHRKTLDILGDIVNQQRQHHKKEAPPYMQKTADHDQKYLQSTFKPQRTAQPNT